MFSRPPVRPEKWGRGKGSDSMDATGTVPSATHYQ